MIINGKRLSGLQAYKEKNKDEYLIVDLNSYRKNPDGFFDSLATAIDGSVSSLCNTTISLEWLEKNCTKTTWKKLPKVWQDGFLNLIELPQDKNDLNKSKQLKLNFN